MDARRNQVYTGLYRFGETFEVVKEQWAGDIRELIKELNERGERVIFLGDGVPVCRHIIEEELSVPHDFAPAHVNRQRGAGVASLGAVYFRGRKDGNGS